MECCSLIVGVKNRLSHFLQTYPSIITQMGVDYEIVIVDFFSNDDLQSVANQLTKQYCDVRSPYLKRISYVRLKEDKPYNPRECKNLGAHYSSNSILAFSDVDVFLGMNYLHELSLKVSDGLSFVATRCQDSMSSPAKRILNYINYGNILVHSKDFIEINGFDESIDFYGGDDDDLCHRLKLKGLREINPYDHLSSCHYSILHGDDLRLGELKDRERKDSKKRFKEIYSNLDYKKSKCEFLSNGTDCELTIL